MFINLLLCISLQNKFCHLNGLQRSYRAKLGQTAVLRIKVAQGFLIFDWMFAVVDCEVGFRVKKKLFHSQGEQY